MVMYWIIQILTNLFQLFLPILAPKAHFYQEVEVRGKNDAEHSWMHDNPFVIDIVDKFLNLKK